MKLADKSAENSNLFTFTKGILNGRGPRFKSLRGSIVNPNIFIQWSMKWVLGIPRDLVVKVKLCPGSVSAILRQLNTSYKKDLKVGLLPSRKKCVICFIESPLQVMKNAYFILELFSFSRYLSFYHDFLVM